MTFQSKAALRRQLALTIEVKDQIIDEKDRAENALYGFGYVLERSGFTSKGGEAIVVWRPSPDLREVQRLERLEQKTKREEAVAAAIETTRRETLTAVIEALGLKGYARGGYVPAGPTIFDTDRLWSEIQTALELKAEKKAQEVRQAAADRIAQAVKPTVDISAALARAVDAGIVLDGASIAKASQTSNNHTKQSTPKKSGAQK